MQLSEEKINDILELGRVVPIFMGGAGKKVEPGKFLRIFDKDPELKKRVQDFLASIPEEKKAENFEKFKKFIVGQMTWADIKGYPKEFLKHLADVAYLKYRKKEYGLAEILFKGLSIIDHTNWYYRAALGAIYQQQELYHQAIEEYSLALKKNGEEMSSLTNRGECYMKLKNNREAIKDFEGAIKLDADNSNASAKRSRALLASIVSREDEEEVTDPSSIPNGEEYNA